MEENGKPLTVSKIGDTIAKAMVISPAGIFSDLRWGEFLLSFVAGFLVPFGLGMSANVPTPTLIKSSLGAGILAAGLYLRNPKKLAWKTEDETAAQEACEDQNEADQGRDTASKEAVMDGAGNPVQ